MRGVRWIRAVLAGAVVFGALWACEGGQSGTDALGSSPCPSLSDAATPGDSGADREPAGDGGITCRGSK
jgi:hypothetical protein